MSESTEEDRNEQLVYDQLASSSTINHQTQFVFIISVVFIFLVAIGILGILIYAVYATFSEPRAHDTHIRDLYNRNIHCTSNMMIGNDATISGECHATQFTTNKFVTSPLIVDHAQFALDGSRSHVVVEHGRSESSSITLPASTQFAGLWVIVTNEQSQNIPLFVHPPSSDLIDHQTSPHSIAHHRSATFVALGPLASGKGKWTRLY